MPPNIIFIVGDDMGWNDIGYHNPDMVTPNLDKLANEGVKLDNYYVQPMCSPSRAAFMTGRYPIRYGLQHDVINPSQPVGLPLNETVFPQKLKQAGYATHMVGKWHLGFYSWEHTPTYRSFDSFLGYYNWGEDYYQHNVTDNCVICSGFNGLDFRNGTEAKNVTGDYSTYFFTEEANRIITNHDAAVPLYLYLPFQACHDPIESPPSQYYMEKCSHIQNITRRQYCAMAGLLDEGIANVTNSLKEAGLWDNSILIFTTDNGADSFLVSGAGNNWPLRGGKRTLWEGGVRAIGFVTSPLLPAAVRGTTSSGLIHATDWFPSLLNLVGVKPETDGFPLDGLDVWKVISEKATSPRQEILLNYDSILGTGSIRYQNWKLLVGSQPFNDWYPVPTLAEKQATHSFNVPNITLYDIVADPVERNDLSQEHPDVVEKLLARLETYKLGSVDPAFPDPDVASNPNNFQGFWTPWK